MKMMKFAFLLIISMVARGIVPGSVAGQVIQLEEADEVDPGRGVMPIVLSEEAKSRIGGQEDDIYRWVRELQCDEVEEITEKVKGEHADDWELAAFCNLSLAACLFHTHWSKEPGEEAKKSLRESAAILERTIKIVPEGTEWQRTHLGYVHYLLAVIYRSLGDFGRAFEENKILAVEYDGVGTGAKENFLAVGGMRQIVHIYREVGWPVDDGVEFFEKVYREKYTGRELGQIALENIYILQYNGKLIDEAIGTLERIDREYPGNEFTEPHRSRLTEKSRSIE